MVSTYSCATVRLSEVQFPPAYTFPIALLKRIESDHITTLLSQGYEHKKLESYRRPN